MKCATEFARLHRFLYKVVHKIGLLRKFNHARDVELNFFTPWTISMKVGTLVHHVNIYKTFPQHFSFLPRDLVILDLRQTEIRNWNAAARERDSNFLPGSRKSRPKLGVKGPVSEKFFRLFFGSTGPWLAPREVRRRAALCVLRLKLLIVRQASNFLVVLWSLGRLRFKLCERSSQVTEQTDRLQACSSVMDRLVSQARILVRFCSACAGSTGSRRSILTVLPTTNLLAHLFFDLPAYVAYVVQIVDAQSFKNYRQGKRSAARPWTATSRRRSSCSLRSPSSWSSNKKAAKLYAAEET